MKQLGLTVSDRIKCSRSGGVRQSAECLFVPAVAEAFARKVQPVVTCPLRLLHKVWTMERLESIKSDCKRRLCTCDLCLEARTNPNDRPTDYKSQIGRFVFLFTVF